MASNQKLTAGSAGKQEVKGTLKFDGNNRKGDHGAASRVMSELESRLHTLVHHEVDADICKQLSCSNDLQQKIEQIEDKNNCSVKTIPVKIGEKYSASGKVKDTSCLTTWVLRDMINCVSIVNGDVQSMKLDAIIILVNSSLFGEGPLAQDIQPLSDMLLGQSVRSKGKLGDVFKGDFKDEMMCKTGFAVVVSSTALTGDAESMVALKNTEMQKSVNMIIGGLPYITTQCNIGVCIPKDEKEFSFDVNDIVEPFLSASKNAVWEQFHLHFCVKSDRERWIQKVNKSLIQWKLIHRRIVDPEVYGIFTAREDTQVNVTETSLQQIEAECLVVSVGSNFNLSYGFVAQQIKDKAGPGLQEELDKSRQAYPQKCIIAARPWNLSNIGVKLLLFVVVPTWKKCERSTKKLQVLVEDCLLLADQNYCKSVAFPVFGIGNLEYPMRDVAVAFFDAIDVFKKQSVFQVISQIYITAPVIKDDDSMLQLLRMEKQRRINSRLTEPCFKQEEICCLSASNSNVVYKVMKKEDALPILGGEYVHVHLDPSQGADEPIQRILSVMVIPCGKSKDALQKSMEDVVNFCEKDRITSICVSLETGFHFPESDQIKIISETVDKAYHSYGVQYNASMVYKYLKTVLITVSGAFTFNAEVLTSGDNVSLRSSLFGRQIENKWKDSSYQMDVYGMNMVVIGECEACERTIKDVNNMCMAIDESLGEQPNHSYTDDRKSGTSMASYQKELGARPKQTGQDQMTSLPTVHVKQQIKENLTFHGNNRKEDLESYQLDTSIDSDVEVLVDDKEKEASCGLASISPSYQVKSETIGSVPEEIYKEERTKQNDKENGNVAAEVPSKGPSSEKRITYQLKRGKIGQYYLIKSDSCPKPFRYTPKYGDVSMDEEDDLLYDGDHCFAIYIEDGRITLDEITDAETTLNSTPVTESDGRCLGVVSASEESISGYGSGDVGALIDQFHKQMVHDKVPVLSDQAIGDQKKIEMKIAQSTIQSGEEEQDIHDDVDTVSKKVPMTTKCKKVEVQRYEPEPEETINPCTVLVSGSGEVLSDLEILELYFESTKRSGGGDIANITYDEALNVVITFENEEDAQRVVEKTDHKVKRQTLTVEQFKPMKKKNVHRQYKEMVSKEVAKKVTKQKLPSCH